MDSEIPITTHPKLPEEVPLVASFHDDRNRLSYYHPRLRSIEGVRTPLTKFLPVEGSFHSYPEIEYRDATRFMQDISTQGIRSWRLLIGKVRGRHGFEDRLTGPLRHRNGSPRTTPAAWPGEAIPRRTDCHQRVGASRPRSALFVRGGSVIYGASLDDGDEFPDATAERIAGHFTDLAWSVDFIRHETTGRWYCIDLGLDGLYHTGTEWIAISEHLEEEHSPQQYTDEMPAPERLRHHR
jgi:hypothetical protein